MDLRSLRLAAVPLAAALVLGAVGAEPAPASGRNGGARPMLRYHEDYRVRLSRFHAYGDTWFEAFSSNQYGFKAVVPIDRDLVDVDAFTGDTEFRVELGNVSVQAVLADDPSWHPGKRSARFVFEEEEIWFGPDLDRVRLRTVGVVRVRWSAGQFTVKGALRPYQEPGSWYEMGGSYIVSEDWAAFSDGKGLEGARRETPEFSGELPVAPVFRLGGAAGEFDDRYEGVGTVTPVVVGSGDDAEEYLLESMRVQGSGELAAAEGE